MRISQHGVRKIQNLISPIIMGIGLFLSEGAEALHQNHLAAPMKLIEMQVKQSQPILIENAQHFTEEWKKSRV